MNNAIFDFNIYHQKVESRSYGNYVKTHDLVKKFILSKVEEIDPSLMTPVAMPFIMDGVKSVNDKFFIALFNSRNLPEINSLPIHDSLKTILRTAQFSYLTAYIMVHSIQKYDQLTSYCLCSMKQGEDINDADLQFAKNLYLN